MPRECGRFAVAEFCGDYFITIMNSIQPAIELINVGLRRGGRWILRGINWSVPAGACVAILGPNGSGKSTLSRILGGHVWPTAGRVRVLGEEFGQTDLAELRQSIRLVQPAGPYDIQPTLTARQVVLSGFFATLALYDTPTASMAEETDRLLGLVGLARVADQPYAQLSSGERVRSLIARAMAHRPKLLLLDEPTAGLDLLAREQVLATVQTMFESRAMFVSTALVPTVILITHHIEELPPATSSVLLLSDGSVAAEGPPGQVLRSEILSPVYGCPVQVRQVAGRYYAEVHPSAWRELMKD